MTPERKAAILHAVGKAAPTTDMPVGTHDLAGVTVEIWFPPGTAVERLPGNIGGGIDEVSVSSAKAPSPAALLRVIASVMKSFSLEDRKSIWLEAIRADLQVGSDPQYPDEALQALAVAQKENGVVKTQPRKSATKAVGLKNARIVIIDNADHNGEGAFVPALSSRRLN